MCNGAPSAGVYLSLEIGARKRTDKRNVDRREPLDRFQWTENVKRAAPKTNLLTFECWWSKNAFDESTCRRHEKIIENVLLGFVAIHNDDVNNLIRVYWLNFFCVLFRNEKCWFLMVDGDTHMKPFGPPESTEIKARDNRRNGEKTNASSGFSCANNVNMVTRPQQRWIFVLFDWGHQFVPFLGMRCHSHKWSLSIIQFSGDYRAFKIDDVPEWLSDDKRGSSGPGHRFWLNDSKQQMAMII